VKRLNGKRKKISIICVTTFRGRVLVIKDSLVTSEIDLCLTVYDKKI
jgi:hypothetical protein